jgi:hypothetical protein
LLTKLIDLFLGRGAHSQPSPPLDLNSETNRALVAPFLIDPDEIDRMLEILSRAKPEDVTNIGPQLGAAILPQALNRHARTYATMRQLPPVAWLLALHRDGYIRQAALEALNAPPITASQFITIALRLNDWVPEVRKAAREAAARLFPVADPRAVAAAAPYLLSRRYLWERWDDEAIVLDEALGRTDVAAELARRLRELKTGPAGITLRMALRFQSLDPYLPDLATRAAHPAVRATALEAIVSGQARWATGFEQVWVDKRYGIMRQVPVVASRPVNLTVEIEPFIRAGLKDPFVAVRKVAADGLYEKRKSTSDALSLAQSLLDDRSVAVRDRASFLVRQFSGKD